MPPAPARLSSRVVRAILKAAPQPVSASTSSGSSLAPAMRHVLTDVIQTGDAEIGKTEGSVGHAGARQVQGAKAGALCQQRRVCVDCTDDLQRSLFCYGYA
jgi:hypothetical protein